MSDEMESHLVSSSEKLRAEFLAKYTAKDVYGLVDELFEKHPETSTSNLNDGYMIAAITRVLITLPAAHAWYFSNHELSNIADGIITDLGLTASYVPKQHLLRELLALSLASEQLLNRLGDSGLKVVSSTGFAGAFLQKAMGLRQAPNGITITDIYQLSYKEIDGLLAEVERDWMQCSRDISPRTPDWLMGSS